jgi:hypothetical protein
VRQTWGAVETPWQWPMAGAGPNVEVGMGATVIGTSTTAEGNANSGAASAEGGGDNGDDDGAGGDGSGCQGRGSCLNLASFSSSRVLLASTLQIGGCARSMALIPRY